MSATRTHGISCPCGWSAQSNSIVWLDFREFLHDTFASPRLRRRHRLDDIEARKKFGV